MIATRFVTLPSSFFYDPHSFAREHSQEGSFTFYVKGKVAISATDFQTRVHTFFLSASRKPFGASLYYTSFSLGVFNQALITLPDKYLPEISYKQNYVEPNVKVFGSKFKLVSRFICVAPLAARSLKACFLTESSPG